MTRFPLVHALAHAVIVALTLVTYAVGNPPEVRFPAKHRAFLQQHCFDCHDSATQEGQVNLESLSFRIINIEQAELWQKILNSLNAGEMPPEDVTQPNNADKADFLDALAQTMVRARQALSDSGGKITMRRLNRREYRNTIKQLTGVQPDVGTLPVDGGSGTFDTVGSSQFISSDQFEQYLQLGRSAIDEALERQRAQTPSSQSFRLEPETTINPANEKEVAAIEDAQRRFTRWQVGVDKAAKLPKNQAKIEEISQQDASIKHPIHFYRHADLLEDAPDPKDYGFSDAAKAASSNPQWDRAQLAYHKHYLTLPHRDRGTYLKLAHGTGRVVVTVNEDLPLGKYVLRVRTGVVPSSPSARHFIQIGHPQRQVPRNRGLAGQPLSTHQVSGTIQQPEIIEIPLEMRPETPREFAIQEKQPNNGNLKALWDAHNRLKRKNGYGHPPAIWIDWVELVGPIDATNKRWKQRREVELHANRKVGGTYNGYFKGGHDKAQAFLQTGKPQKGMVDEQEAKFRIRQFEEQGPTYRRYLDDPLTQSGSFLTIADCNKEEFIALPPEHPTGWLKTEHVVPNLPPGEYKLRFRLGAIPGTPSDRHFVDLGAVPEKNAFNQIATFQITGSIDQPQTIEVPVQLAKNSPRKFALREKRDPKLDNQRDRAARKATGVGPVPALWIDWVEWEGPFSRQVEASPLQAIIADNTRRLKQPNATREKTSASPIGESNFELPQARATITEFARAAFRGVKPDRAFIDKLVAIYQTRRQAGESFDAAIRTPLSVILASPGFLYLNEPSDESQPRPLNDRELAVRLAYFLWSGPPDAELLQLANDNQLHLPKILEQQVDRLIADPRSDEFVAGFVHQWLEMERLDFFQFDANLYQDFDESTRAATRQEVYHSFAHLLRCGVISQDAESKSPTTTEQGRIGKLLKSDYVFVNGLLANYYGMEGVSGDAFRKINLPADSPRGGLLGMAAIHAMGSDGIVSSPVERGAWVLRYLLNDPPPPAPPNVPQISRLEGQVLTARERLLAHQQEPQCASCHRKIDPIGFGLENFNAAGKWRTEDSYQARDNRGRGVGKRQTWTIDPSGAFHQGLEFSGYQQLRDRIAEREEDFARGFTEHLIEYALGRSFGFTDKALADEIVTSARGKDFAVSQFIRALAQSKAFQTK